MSPPTFSLSLDEFPVLLDEPPQSETFLGETVMEAMRTALETYPMEERGYYSPYLNELRHSFAEMGDERSSMAFADIMLAYEPSDSYTLSILSNWASESEPEKAVCALLDKAARFRDLPSLYASSLKRASEICYNAGLHDVARQLFFAWQELPIPIYAELRPLIGQIISTSYASTIPHKEITHEIPSPVEGAQNGWRNGKWNPITPQQEQELRTLIEKHEAQPWADTIVAMAQNCVRFERLNSKNNLVGSSHFGGLPDVPPNWAWPDNLEFLAQFNLKEIAPFDVNHALPSRGLLRVFVGSIWSGDINRCQIEWDESSTEQLNPAPCPLNYAVHGLDEVDGNRPVVYSPIAVSPCHTISVESTPIYEYYKAAGLLEEDYSDYIEDIQREFLPYGLGGNHQLLGSYDDGQKEAHDARHFDSSTGDRVEFRRGADEWTLLFQIDSNDELGTHFSDIGTVYFMIRCEDLAARRFDRVFVTMTCG